MISLEDIRRAHERIVGSIVPTPFELSRTLSAKAGTQLYLKAETSRWVEAG